jgi:hypothetical protein
MAGFGSGQRSTHATVEDSLRLDLAQPSVRKALGRRAVSDGVWTWASGGRDIANVGYTWVRPSLRLFLRYACNGQPTTQAIALEHSQPHWGGNRLWFLCPVTGKRVRALYLPSGATRWASRAAHDLRYESQRACGPLSQFFRDFRRFDARETRNQVRRITRKQRALPLRPRKDCRGRASIHSPVDLARVVSLLYRGSRP